MMTSEFVWESLPQTRCGVLVSRVVALLAKNPREVVDLDLSEWALEEHLGRYAVVHVTGLGNGVRPEKIPPTLTGRHPILVGQGNGRTFLIDGAHRVARALIEKRKTIPAVILTEEETRACVRAGQMNRFDRETK